MKKHLSIVAASLLAATLFVGCGSDDDSSSTNTGYLVDAAVANIDFTCGNNSGVTGENGKFQYNTGDECTFSVGSVVIGKVKPDNGVKGEGVVTPLDLAGVTDPTAINDPKVVEISKLFIALDSDNDPNNGITVSDDVKNDLEKLDAVNLASGNVTVDTIVADLKNVNPNVDIQVPTEDEVVAHLENLDSAIKEVKPEEETPDANSENVADNAANANTNTGDCLPGQDCTQTTDTTANGNAADCLPGQDCTQTTDTTANGNAADCLPGQDCTQTTDTTATNDTAAEADDNAANANTDTGDCLPGQSCN